MLELCRDEWTRKDITELQILLHQMGNATYQAFQMKLIPGEDNVIGIKLPVLRDMARQIAKGNAASFLKVAKLETYEERMIKGFVIGQMKADFKIICREVETFVPHISNWSVCDSFCAGLKCFKKHGKEGYEFLQPYLFSQKEFEKRFGIVMLMDYYIQDDFIEEVLSYLIHVHNEDYYVNMAVAWAISVCFVKYPVKTKEALIMVYQKLKHQDESSLEDSLLCTEQSGDFNQAGQWINKFTYQKSLQKILESYRVMAEDKAWIRSMKLSKERKNNNSK